MAISNALQSFLDDNSPIFIEWLRKSKYCFPYCCTIASEVLGSYINEHFGEAVLVHGYFEPEIEKLLKRDNTGLSNHLKFPFHCWLEVEDKIIDFTVFQFMKINDGPDNSINTPFELILAAQGGFVIAPHMPLYGRYSGPIKKYYCDQFRQYASSRMFGDYLNCIVNTQRYKRYKFGTDLQRVPKRREENPNVRNPLNRRQRVDNAADIL